VLTALTTISSHSLAAVLASAVCSSVPGLEVAATLMPRPSLLALSLRFL